VILTRRFAAIGYLSIDAENEDETRRILESIEIESPHKDRISWNDTEVEEVPDL
jgi:hypothetical protein